MSKVVLLVEDNDFVRKMYQFKLAKSGIEVIEAQDGESALKAIKEQKPDLVLLDIMMPGMSGIDVLKQLKKDKIVPKIPVIVLTNVMNQQSIEECKKLGALDYIVKTDLTPSQVLDKIQACLK
ncbi:MAG: response regulator [bacterium]|nr:response regulator [bacterium]